MRKLALLLIYALGLGLAQAPPPAAKQERPAFTLPSWVTVDKNISYDQHSDTVLDILQPKASLQRKRPGVIVIHGGGWVRGNKDAMLEAHCMPYLAKGFVVANVEYRLAGVAPAPAAAMDVLKAAEWFRKNAGRYDVDKNRIVVTGTSAGGHLALMVGLANKSAKLGSTTKIAAVVNFYGITDVADQLNGPNMQQYAVTWVPDQEGRIELARRVSPLTYVREDVPPVLTIHGDADMTVPYEHGAKLTKALRDEGADAELIPIAHGGHGNFGPEKMKDIYERIFRWLERRNIVAN